MTVTLQKTQTLFHKMYWKVPVVRMCKFGLTAIAALHLLCIRFCKDELINKGSGGHSEGSLGHLLLDNACGISIPFDSTFQCVRLCSRQEGSVSARKRHHDSLPKVPLFSTAPWKPYEQNYLHVDLVNGILEAVQVLCLFFLHVVPLCIAFEHPTGSEPLQWAHVCCRGCGIGHQARLRWLL